MKICIIGSGNVAYHLAKAFKTSGINVDRIYGRNEAALREISASLDIPFATGSLPEAELYIISVKDDAIAEVSSFIQDKKCLVAHTSGSVPMQSLRGGYRKAVLYPLQTFSKEKNLSYRDIPFFVEAENEKDEKLLIKLAGQISDKVSLADSVQRRYIHLAAVFACNFVNHLFARAKEIAENHGIAFDNFLPLITETVGKIYTMDPKEVQTGPAVRGDFSVIAAHRLLLEEQMPQKIFDVMNESIIEMYHPRKKEKSRN